MTAQVDILLVTVNPHETTAVLQAFQEATGSTAVPVPIEDRVYRDLGTLNGTRVLHALSEMGSAGLGGTQQTVEKAIRAVRPGAVIAIGIAFGVNYKRQSIGDILVSAQLRLYDLQRAGAKIILRGDKPHASTRLINFFEGMAQTSWPGRPVRTGVILTGDKLVDSIDYRNQLLEFESEAIGGEMEGAGVYVASHEHKVDWIVIKAICDWGDGQKAKNKKARQRKAAHSAAAFLVHALKQAQLTRDMTRSYLALDTAAHAQPTTDTLARVSTFVDYERKLQLKRQVWNLPHPRNPNFIGRERLLSQLDEQLNTGEPAALVPEELPIRALTGLGGIGKTQIAIAYAYANRDRYNLVWWLRAEEPMTLAADFARMAEPLALLETSHQEQEIVIGAVRRWLDSNRGWLLIFDNAEDGRDLKPFLPYERLGKVIITSRNPAWSGLAQPLLVNPLSENEGIRLLTKQQQAPHEDTAREVVMLLGGLPLALSQAGAYMDETACSIHSYLDLIKSSLNEIMARGRPADYAEPVSAVLRASFEQAEVRCSSSAALINIFAFLAPDAIPLDLLAGSSENLPLGLRTHLDRQDAIGALRRFSLIEVEDPVINMHRLVQAISQSRLTEDEQKSWAATAIRLVDAAIPEEAIERSNWSVYNRLLSHGLSAADYAERFGIEPMATSRVLDRIGTYHQVRGLYANAEPLFRRAVQIGNNVLGPSHSSTAIYLNNLAWLYHQQGRFGDALPLYKHAIDICLHSRGMKKQNLAEFLNNLALLYHDQQLYDEALPLYERAIEAGVEAHGPDHVWLACPLNNLANLFRNTGRFDEALSLYQRALRIREKVLPPVHQEMATSFCSIAILYGQQGRFEEALQLFKRAIEIDEEVFGQRHREVAIDLSHLAHLYHAAGRFAEACPNYELALDIMGVELGAEHPLSQTTRAKYEECLRQGKLSPG
jgi:nucleoside phosphorylase/tetratricopeptide (TPR) repeat protein